MTEPPLARPKHRCYCVLVDVRNQERDRCGMFTDADQPVCDECEEAGHNNLPTAMPLAQVLAEEQARQRAVTQVTREEAT